jgi:transcriptional regulator with XRE-family HTH domain
MSSTATLQKEFFLNISCSIPISIGEMIAIHRDRLKMSQSALANAVGISRNYVSLIERGNEHVSYAIMLKICDVLGLELIIKMAEGGRTSRALDGGTADEI